MLTDALAMAASRSTRGRLGAEVTNARFSRACAAPLPRTDTVTSTVTKPYPIQSGKTGESVTRSATPLRKAAKGEKDFMRDLHDMLIKHNPDAAESELTNWGGWWRNRFRTHPAKAHRVLAELLCLVKEGRIRKTPGAAGMDLWGRLP